jgi:hypothetical protein
MNISAKNAALFLITEIHDELRIRVNTNMPLNESIRQVLSHDHFSASQ